VSSFFGAINPVCWVGGCEPKVVHHQAPTQPPGTKQVEVIVTEIVEKVINEPAETAAPVDKTPFVIIIVVLFLVMLAGGGYFLMAMSKRGPKRRAGDSDSGSSMGSSVSSSSSRSSKSSRSSRSSKSSKGSKKSASLASWAKSSKSGRKSKR